MNASTIAIEVVYALPERQTLLKLDVTRGTTVGRALVASGILALHPEIDLVNQRVGIFGQFVENDHVLASGDRIEIYRPLVADPKASRHARVAKRRADRDSDRKMRA
jgi:putative ubiquitin-RnfH superfamily antitoxin RatB of RatAB toxin-antitoxin module